jgi:hypothetical protein
MVDDIIHSIDTLMIEIRQKVEIIDNMDNEINLFQEVYLNEKENNPNE